MKRLAGVVGAVLAFLGAGDAFADTVRNPSLIDLYQSGCSDQLFHDHPDAIGFATVGDEHGRRFARLMDEVANVFSTLNAMMDEAGVSGADLREIRIASTSSGDQEKIRTALEADSRFRTLPISYEVVKVLPVPWARVGLYAVGEKAGAGARLVEIYGQSPPAPGKPGECHADWAPVRF